MKKILFFAFSVLLTANVLYAGEYAGLTPGVSSKADAHKALGTPLKVNDKGSSLDYSTEGHDLKRLSVGLAEDGDTVKSIHLVFKKPYTKAQIKKWFSLSGVADETEQVDGHLIEVFRKPGIKIVFEGADKEGRIIELSHVDLAKEEQTKTLAAVDSCPEAADKYARQADPFIEKDQYERAIPYLKKAALCDPEKSIYSSMLAVAYYETGKTNEAVEAAEHSVHAGENYVASALLGTIYFEKKKFKQAIPYFQRAVDIGHSRDKDLENLEYLGTCFYEEGRLQEAMATFTKVNKRMKKRPITCYYIGLISDRLGDIAGAKFYYKKFLRLKYDNQDMNILVKERLGALNRQSREKSSRSISDLIGVVTKEITDFNSD